MAIPLSLRAASRSARTPGSDNRAAQESEIQPAENGAGMPSRLVMTEKMCIIYAV